MPLDELADLAKRCGYGGAVHEGVTGGGALGAGG